MFKSVLDNARADILIFCNGEAMLFEKMYDKTPAIIIDPNKISQMLEPSIFNVIATGVNLVEVKKYSV